MIRSFTFSRSKWSSSSTCRALLEVEVVLGRLVPGQREDPVEVRADDAVLGGGRRAASRAGRARGRPPCATSSGSFTSSTRSRSSATSACSGSPSPSSSWIAFSCWRRKYSRWPFSISDCDLRLDLRAELDDLELAVEDRRALRAGAPRRRPARAAAASPRSSGAASRRRGGRARSGRRRSRRRAAAPRAGTGRAPMMRAKSVWTLRRQRLDLGRLLEHVRHLDELADEVRLVLDPVDRAGSARRPGRGCAASRRGPGSSCGRPRRCRPRRGRPSRAARPPRPSTVTSASSRSPATTSSTSLIERSWPIASGRHRLGEDDRLLQRQDRQRRDGSSSSSTSTCSSTSSLIGAILTRIATRSARAGFCASGSTIVSSPRSYVAFAGSGRRRPPSAI